LIAYRRVSDAVTTHYLKLPDSTQGAQAGQEIATLPDGRTVVALFAGSTLPPDQPSAIAASIETLTLTDALKEQIKAASPQVRLISDNMQRKIREVVSAEDEMYFARISIGALSGQYTMEPGEAAAVAAYGVFVEGVRQWGRDQRAALGL
jgi:hypothetical protein